jgi:hypothetical protein
MTERHKLRELANDLMKVVDAIEQIAFDRKPAQLTTPETHPEDWISRTEAMDLSGKRRANNFSEWYRNVGVRTDGHGHSKLYFKPDIINPPRPFDRDRRMPKTAA